MQLDPCLDTGMSHHVTDSVFVLFSSYFILFFMAAAGRDVDFSTLIQSDTKAGITDTLLIQTVAMLIHCKNKINLRSFLL